MVEVVRRRRRSAVLTPSRIPCLGKICTINITQGCAIGCGYCYIQGYSDYPGPGKVILYENTAELLASELQRRRRKPERVYFSPSSDAFQDIPEVQELTYRTMSLLLDVGVEVSFLTKGFVTERFFELFKKAPAAVFAQVGITTLDPVLSTNLERGAASPTQRLETMRRLSDIGVQTTARLDPLIPDVTDARSNIEPLLASLCQAGVRFGACPIDSWRFDGGSLFHRLSGLAFLGNFSAFRRVIEIALEHPQLFVAHDPPERFLRLD